ncbi:hypothetical protein QBC35DRAFT_501781 [Podospora australis]|uniref:RBR-type E3 ubiquitin transferase n=1 Tax=Podospora australis TaxID=1536484 RepID=A0AAN6WQL6_9PEZI|nr:hypothetical protein QBC35DRAFT_501781 [Podospora australis]
MLSLLDALRETENFVWCWTAGCGNGHFHEGGNDQPIVTCSKCGHRTCFQHQVPWHTDKTCKEYDAAKAAEAAQAAEAAKAAEAAMEAAQVKAQLAKDAARRKKEEEQSQMTVQTVSKPCPTCKIPIQNFYGCDHIECTKCSAHFCWRCGTLYPCLCTSYRPPYMH